MVWRATTVDFILTGKSGARYNEVALPTVLDIPPARRGLLNFRIFDTPVQVQPWFWLITLLLGWSQDFATTAIWVVVVFFSILAHEFGHIAAYRLYGVPGAVLLYSWGGLAIPRREIRGTLARIVVAFAGPLAGFCVAALTVAVAMNRGVEFQAGFRAFVIPSIVPVAYSRSYWMVALSDLLFVNIYWGLVNLLPVSPLDGSHVSRAILQAMSPAHWKKPWALLSAAVALGIAALGFFSGNLYLGIMFVLLGIGSLQMLG